MASSKRRLSRSYKRRMRQRALLVVALIILTALILYLSLHRYQAGNNPDIRTMMPDPTGD